jgi:hypothetical protein
MSMTKRSFPKSDLTGKRFGRLIVTEFLSFYEKNARRHAMWSVTCDCGVVKSIKGNQLTSGGTISCGCALRDEYDKLRHKTSRRNQKPHGLAAFNELLNSYKQRARRAKISFNLSTSQFKILTSLQCHYCGVEPKQISPVPARRKNRAVNGYYYYNGIDRLDSDMGYEAVNCVPCCEICNKAKRDLKTEDFYEWIQRLIKFQTQEN